MGGSEEKEEGSRVRFPECCADEVDGGACQVDTRDILFICGGAFVDLEKVIKER